MSPSNKDSSPQSSPLGVVFSKRGLLIGLLAASIAGGLLVARYIVVEPPPLKAEVVPFDTAFVRVYDPPRTKMDTILDVADGQAWAAMGTDPTFSQPDNFYEGKQELVYRGSKPLFPWLIWLGSGGQPAGAPLALLVLTCLGVGFCAMAGMGLAQFAGKDPIKGALITILPGAVSVVLTLGPEPFALGLAICGLLAWYANPRKVALAVVLFSFAALARDVTLVIPVVIALHEVVHHRRKIREVLVLAIPILVLGAWIGSLALRYGVQPFGADSAGTLRPPRLSLPFVGFVRSVPDMPQLQWAFFVIGVGLVAFAIARDRRSVLTWTAIAYCGVATVFGPHVWLTEFHRVLYPMYAFAFIVALPTVGRPQTGSGARPRVRTENRER